jgi:hypothetical protein
MAQRMYSSQKMLEEKTAQANKPQSQGNGFAKAEFVDLKPDVATGETVRYLRIIGCPIQFRQFTDKKPDWDRRNAGEKGATKKVAFPDAHLNSKYTRIGTEGDASYGECPWQKLGYIGSWRYAVNVLERQADGTSVVKILEKGAMIFNKLMEYETTNRETNDENPNDEPQCVMLGGAVAHDIKIKAKANPNNAMGGVDYVISVNPKKTQVTDEEIAMLKALGCPTDEEIANERATYEKDRKEDTQLPEWDDWYLYGYNIANIFKPTPIKTGDGSATAAPAAKAESTHSDELVIDEAPEPVAAAPKAAKAAKTPKAAPAELANPFDEDSDSSVAVAEEADGDPDW